MSTIGSSAAGLVSIASVLKPISGSSSTNSVGRGPSRISDQQNATILGVGEPSDIAVGSLAKLNDHKADNGIAKQAAANPFPQDNPTAYDAKQHLDEQSERIADLVDRFEKAIGRIKFYLRSNDVDNPPGPTDIGRRMSEKLVEDATRILASGGQIQSDQKSLSTRESEDRRLGLDILA